MKETRHIRVDKWLDVACIFKTRSQARGACLKGRVSINGRVCKPRRPVKVGEEISIRHSGWTRILRVLELASRSISRSEAKSLYDDLTPDRPKMDPIERIMRVSRPGGSGRPTKKQRRSQSRLRRR